MSKHNPELAVHCDCLEARLSAAEAMVEAAKYVLAQAASRWPDLDDAIRRYEEGK